MSRKKTPYKPELWSLLQECERILGEQATRSYRLTPQITKRFQFGTYPRVWEASVDLMVSPTELRDTRYHVRVEVRWPSYGSGRAALFGHRIATMNLEASELALACQAVVEGYTYTRKQAEKSWDVLVRMRELDEKDDR